MKTTEKEESIEYKISKLLLGMELEDSVRALYKVIARLTLVYIPIDDWDICFKKYQQILGEYMIEESKHYGPKPEPIIH